MADGAEQFDLARNAEAVAADLCDPVAFEARLAEARERRAVALAHRAPARPSTLPVLTAPPDQRPRDPAGRRPGLLLPVVLGGLVLAAGAAATLTLTPRPRAPAPVATPAAPALAGLPGPVALPAPAAAAAAVTIGPPADLQIAATADTPRPSLVQAALTPPRALAGPLAARGVSMARTASRQAEAMSPVLSTAATTPALARETRSAAADGTTLATAFPVPAHPTPARGGRVRHAAPPQDPIQAALDRASRRLSRWIERAKRSLANGSAHRGPDRNRNRNR